MSIGLVSCTELTELKGNSKGKFGPYEIPRFQFTTNIKAVFKCVTILRGEDTFLNNVKLRHSGENGASSEK